MAWKDPKPNEDQGGKHERKHSRCGGTGQVVEKIVDRETGEVKEHTATCTGCGGTGRA